MAEDLRERNARIFCLVFTRGRCHIVNVLSTFGIWNCQLTLCWNRVIVWSGARTKFRQVASSWPVLYDEHLEKSE